MDRQRRSASKVTDYRKYHLSGDLEQTLQGKVSGTVELLEGPLQTTMATSPVKEDATPEELQELLKEHKDNSARLQQQVEALRLRNELEAEKMQQQQWELTIEQLKHSCELMAQQHELNMNKIRCMVEEATKETGNQAVAWMNALLIRRQVSLTATVNSNTPHGALGSGCSLQL